MDTKSQSQPPDAKHVAAALTGRILQAVVHLSAVGIIAALVALMVFDTETLGLFYGAVSSGSFSPDWARIGLHFGLAASLWALVVIVYHLVRSRGPTESRIVRRSNGSVMVETLVVLLPFLLLTSGVAQLAINNVASVLAHYAAFQGARTAWLWEPEVDSGRHQNLTSSDVRQRARLATAASLTPSAPGDYQMNSSQTPTILENFRGTMTASFADGWRKEGSQGKQLAQTAINENRGQGTSEHTFAGALDSQSLPIRAARKLTFAYQAFSDFTYINNSSDVGVDFTYELHQVFPWFAYIHGDRTTIAGRTGYYVPISRRATLRPQVDMYEP